MKKAFIIFLVTFITYISFVPPTTARIYYFQDSLAQNQTSQEQLLYHVKVHNTRKIMTINQGLTYPQTRKSDQIDDYHGVQVADPYRWLENPDSPETKTWVEAENQLTFSYLNKIPARDKIKQRLTQLWDYEKYGTPFKSGNRYFFFKNNGLQNQSVLYTLKNLDDEPEILIDPTLTHE
jgi:prolyl oligopeptidase